MGTDPEPAELPEEALGSEPGDAEAADLAVALKDVLGEPAEEEEEEEEPEGEESEEEPAGSEATAAAPAVPAAAPGPERNAEAEDCNERIRSLLRTRKRQRAAAEPALPEDFISLAPPAAAPAQQAAPPPWLGPRPRPSSPVLRLHEELLDFAGFMRQTREELVARRKWVRTIGNACRALWPECKVRVFGSSSTGLCLPNGDVDVVALNVPCGPGVAMKLLADRMLAAREISWLELVESAKVPVLKIRSQASGLRADVVFEQPNGLHTSAFLRERLQEFPQMVPLILFLKYFLLQRGLGDTYTGGMGSWLLCNVVLHFLQRHPSRRCPKDYAAISLGHLLFDFFRYYGEEFQYEWQGISVVDGGCIFDKAQRGWLRGYRRGGGNVHLCIEAPLGPARDLGAPVFRMGVLRSLFAHGLRCLCHLFLSPPEAGASLLCPLLLDPGHPVIAQRHALQAEQPVALPGVPCLAQQPGEEGEKDEGGIEEAELDVLDNFEVKQPPSKRIKLDVDEDPGAGRRAEAGAEAGAAAGAAGAAAAAGGKDAGVCDADRPSGAPGEPLQSISGIVASADGASEGACQAAEGGDVDAGSEDSEGPAG